MTDWLLPALAGFGTGILSAWGVGGGTLLLLLMTLFLGVDQTQAQGINLLYFLPTAGMSLLEHRKNGYLDREVMRAAIPLGTLAALAAASGCSDDVQKTTYSGSSGFLGRHHGIPQAVRRFPALGGRQYAAAKKEMRQCRTHCLIFHTKQVCTSSI